MPKGQGCFGRNEDGGTKLSPDFNTTFSSISKIQISGDFRTSFTAVLLEIRTASDRHIVVETRAKLGAREGLEQSSPCSKRQWPSCK